jgi:hypothetical protein
MRLGVPFIAPRQLGAVGDPLGRLSLTSVEWHTGLSGAPPNSSCRRSDVRSPSWFGISDCCSYGLIGASDTVRCTSRPLEQSTCRAKIARPTVGAGDRWLIGQSDAPPDSAVHHQPIRWIIATSPICFSRGRRVRRGWLTGQSGAPPDGPVNFSRTPPSSPESGEFTRTSLAYRTLSGAPLDTVRCAKPSWSLLHIANSFSNSFLTVSST